MIWHQISCKINIILCLLILHGPLKIMYMTLYACMIVNYLGFFVPVHWIIHNWKWGAENRILFIGDGCRSWIGTKTMSRDRIWGCWWLQKPLLHYSGSHGYGWNWPCLCGSKATQGKGFLFPNIKIPVLDRIMKLKRERIKHGPFQW